MTDRDPRTDPRPGDVLKNAGWVFYVLLATDAEVVAIKKDNFHGAEPVIVDIAWWKLAMSVATIIRRAEDVS